MLYKSKRKEPVVKDIIEGLIYAKPAIMTLKNQGKEYDPLIDEIMVMVDPLARGVVLKPIYTKLGITQFKFSKWAQELYADFTARIGYEAYEKLEPALLSYELKNVLFGISGYDYNLYCQLSHIPRIGEQVQLPPIGAEVGWRPFYVKEISYLYENNDLFVFIDVERLSPFLSQLKDRAIFDKKLDNLTANEISDEELEDFLRQLYGNQSNPVPARLTKPYYRR